MAIPARGAQPIPEDTRIQPGGDVPPTTPAGVDLNAFQETARSSALAATLFRSLRMRIGLAIFACFALMAIFGPLLVRADPQGMTSAILEAPSAAHWLGTTQTGQDVLAQLLNGARTSLLVGFLAGSIATILSVIFGVTSGYLGGAADEGISMVANIFLVIPALPLLIVLASYLTVKGPLTIGLVISVTGWAWGARVLRAQTLSMRKRDFVEAARASGESTLRIIFVEILPNEVAIVASSFIGTVIYAIITEASLAFLGLSDVTMTSWGTMLYWAENNNALLVGAWWWFVPPGLCIALVGAGLALINFGIDEIMNPRLRSGTSRGPTRRRGSLAAEPSVDGSALRSPLVAMRDAESN
ncbi:MAG TPA: ABC transporter permease [Ktedonobacterales bacterium]|jgi:peptide/nickel transport system permease protein|nr:ABC transporter permease [Ktedonobacterales bacterium]